MLPFTAYDNATGEIVATYLVGSIEEAQVNVATLPAPATLVEGHYRPATHYFDGGVLTEKSVLSPTVSGATVSGLPIACTISVMAPTADNDGIVRRRIVDPPNEQAPNPDGSFTVTEAVGYHLVTIKATEYRDCFLLVRVT